MECGIDAVCRHELRNGMVSLVWWASRRGDSKDDTTARGVIVKKRIRKPYMRCVGRHTKNTGFYTVNDPDDTHAKQQLTTRRDGALLLSVWFCDLKIRTKKRRPDSLAGITFKSATVFCCFGFSIIQYTGQKYTGPQSLSRRRRGRRPVLCSAIGFFFCNSNHFMWLSLGQHLLIF